MKKTVTYLFIVFLASLIFYGGAGVNFVTYCCNDCRTEGVAVLLNDNCLLSATSMAGILNFCLYCMGRVDLRRGKLL